MTLEIIDKMENDDAIKFLLEQIKELKEKVDKLENENRYRDSNNKLSNYAQKAIEASKGPLKPDELQNFLTDDVLNKHDKKILPIIRKYSDDIDGVKDQILWVYDNIETHMIHRKQQKELDDRLIRKIKKVKKSVEEEQDKENKTHLDIETHMIHRKQQKEPDVTLIKKVKKMKKSVEEEQEKENKAPLDIQTHIVIHRKQQKEPGGKLIKKEKQMKKFVEEEQDKENKAHFKIQSTLDQYFQSKSDKASDGNRKELAKPKVHEASETSKHAVTVNLSEKANRKRKRRVNDEISSSQESGVTRLSSGFSKHLKLNSPENSAESSPELMSVEELDECNSQHTEPMSVESAEGSQSITEPMSVESAGDSQSSPELMSIVNSEESSSQSDVMSADESAEIVKKTKSTKKLRGKVSKQAESRLEIKDAADHTKNEETVPERNLRVRK